MSLLLIDLELKRAVLVIKLFFVPENYREDYAKALKKRDMDDFLEKYKGYHTKAELAVGGATSAALAGWAYHSAKKRSREVSEYKANKSEKGSCTSWWYYRRLDGCWYTSW